MSVFIWFTIVGLDGTEYLEFIDCRPYGLFNSMVSVLMLVMFDFNGMRQSIDTGNRQTFNTSASDIYILEVRPS